MRDHDLCAGLLALPAGDFSGRRARHRVFRLPSSGAASSTFQA